MKKLYHSVVITLTAYAEEDVLTTSGVVEEIYGEFDGDNTGKDIWG